MAVKNKRFIEKGVSILEIIVVVAILAVTLTALLGLASFSLGIQDLMRQTIQAKDLAQEAMEATRSIRDNRGWSFITNGNYGLANTGNYWNFSGTGDVVGIFTRTISIANAMRASDDIVESGGTVDPDTKKITVRVDWSERGRPHNIQLTTYLTNWK